MTAGSVARATVGVCLVAAAAEVALGCTSTAGLSAADAPVALFVVGPYLVLAAVAWRQRRRPAAARVLLAAAVGLSAWGLYAFGVDSYGYHTEPEYRGVQRTVAVFVPLGQWAAVLPAGLGLLAWRPASGRGRPAEAADPGAAPDRAGGE